MKTLGKIAVLLGTIALLTYILIDKYHVNMYFTSMTQEEKQDNDEKFIEQLREGMLSRERTIELSYKGDADTVHEFVGDAITKVFEIDDDQTTSDFDYLRYCYLGTEIKIKGFLDTYNVIYTFEYNETKEQTEIVDKNIKSALKVLNIVDETDYEKIKAIHNYIIKNASYDVRVEKNSAYDNLINRSSVCQGYALLTYKMMKEAGIDCRIITGQGKGVSHAWNIVKLDGNWYNIDCTWDDPVSSDKKEHLEYTYFLKSNNDFGDHVRDKEFNTERFNESYKMADISY
ncbi:MAG: transglutaminase domain-containing protein [bacterium]|nr:transglutaminase domain-containing protein [bacterium]